MSNLSTDRYNLDNLEATFREFLISENVTPITLKNYLSDLRHFLGWIRLYIQSKEPNSTSQNTEITIFAHIDIESVEQYKAYLENNKLPLKSVNRRLSTLRKFCTFAIAQNWMKENPAKQVGNAGIEMSLRVPKKQPQHAGRSNSDEIATLPTVARNDILEQFKKDLLSQQSDPMSRDGACPVATSDVNLVLDDISEFFTIINY